MGLKPTGNLLLFSFSGGGGRVTFHCSLGSEADPMCTVLEGHRSVHNGGAIIIICTSSRYLGFILSRPPGFPGIQ